MAFLAPCRHDLEPMASSEGTFHFSLEVHGDDGTTTRADKRSTDFICDWTVGKTYCPDWLFTSDRAVFVNDSFDLFHFLFLVASAGFEPATCWFEANCSSPG